MDLYLLSQIIRLASVADNRSHRRRSSAAQVRKQAEIDTNDVTSRKNKKVKISTSTLRHHEIRSTKVDICYIDSISEVDSQDFYSNGSATATESEESHSEDSTTVSESEESYSNDYTTASESEESYSHDSTSASDSEESHSEDSTASESEESYSNDSTKASDSEESDSESNDSTTASDSEECDPNDSTKASDCGESLCNDSITALDSATAADSQESISCDTATVVDSQENFCETTSTADCQESCDFTAEVNAPIVKNKFQTKSSTPSKLLRSQSVTVVHQSSLSTIDIKSSTCDNYTQQLNLIMKEVDNKIRQIIAVEPEGKLADEDIVKQTNGECRAGRHNRFCIHCRETPPLNQLLENWKINKDVTNKNTDVSLHSEGLEKPVTEPSIIGEKRRPSTTRHEEPADKKFKPNRC